MENKLKLTCLGLNCPERKSLCCGAGSILTKRKDYPFACKNCGKEFEGGEWFKNIKTNNEWEKEFDIREAKIWQFAGQHPDFRSHTCQLVKEFIRNLLSSERQKSYEEGRGDKISFLDAVHNEVSIERQRLREEIEKQIDFFAQHCENKKPQHKCSACIVLGDLKLKLLEE